MAKRDDLYYEDLIPSIDAEIDFKRDEEEEARIEAELLREGQKGFMDTAFPGSDFIGNTLWGALEAVYIPSVIDQAVDNKISRFLGHQEWDDESWAGKAGYAVGSGAGMLGAFKWWGKGLQGASRLAGMGAKGAQDDIAKGLVDIAGKKGNKTLAKKYFNEGNKAIDDALNTAWKETTPFMNMIQRSKLRHNPLGSPIVQGSTFKILGKTLKEDLGLNPKQTKEALGLIMKNLQQYRGHNIQHTLTKMAVNRGWSERAATRMGDALYEASLLATWDVFAGEASDIAAEYAFGLDDEQWGYKSWWSRAMHGAVTGSILSQVRTIGGGRETIPFQNGLLADIKNAAKAVRFRFKNVEKMSPKSKQAALNTFLESSKGNYKMFADVPGVDRVLLGKEMLSTADVKILDNAIKHFKGNIPRFIAKLTQESMKDIAFSSPRMLAGGIAMNALGWHDMWNKGIIQSGEYTPEQAAFDTFVGSLYMKRGKRLPGDKPSKFPRFYAEKGMEPNGSEISKMIEFMDIMGYSETQLEMFQAYKMMDPATAMESSILRQQIKGNPDLKVINDVVKQDLIDGLVAADIITEGNPNHIPGASSWKVHVRDKVTQLLSDISKAKDGSPKKQKLQAEYESLIESYNIAEVVEQSVLLGHSGKTTRPMTASESMAYVDKLSKIKVDGGSKSLTGENVNDVISRLRDSSVNDITSAVRDNAVDYIMRSLESLGLATESQLDPRTGRIHIHESVLEALEMNKGKTVEGELKYHDSFYSLSETIKQAQAAGMVQISDKGMRFSTQGMSPAETLNKFDRVYREYTEQMHDLVFNNQTSSNWRSTVPGYTEDSGFYDNSIMGSPAVWHSIQTQNRVARMKFAYDVLTNNRSTTNAVAEQFTKIRDWFNGKSKIKIKGGEEGEMTVQLQEFMDRINQMRELLNPNPVDAPAHEVGIKELEMIRQKVSDPVDGLGNIIIDPAEFHHFSEYVYQRYVNEITGNPNIGHGLKLAIVQALDTANPLSVRRGGRVELITSRTLRDLLLEGKVSVGEERNKAFENVQELINLYEQKIENQLRINLSGSGSQVTFNDNIKPSLNIIDKRNVIQSLRDMINQVDRIGTYEITAYTNELGKLNIGVGKMLDKLAESEIVSPDGKANEKLSLAIRDLASEAGNLQAQLQILLNNRDAVGLKILTDSRLKLSEIVNKLNLDPVTDSKSILRYKEQLNNFLESSLRKRNEQLFIDGVETMNDYVQEQLSDLAMSDRTTKIKSHSNSISDNQYLTKWFSPNETRFLETIKKKPIDILNKIENLSKESRSLIEKYNEDSSIIDFSSDSFMGVKSYIDNILSPIIESQRPRIEALKDTRLGANAKERFDNFLFDSYQVIVSGLATKEMPIAIFDNGTLVISKGTVSNWNVGFNKLESKLGLSNIDGSILLGGQRTGTKRGYTSRMNRELLDQIEAIMSKGVFLDISNKEIMSGQESTMIEGFENVLTGSGFKGSTKYLPIVLDQSTTVYLHKGAQELVLRKWNNPDSSIRKDLEAIYKNVEGGESIINKYLTGVLGAKVDASGHLNLPKDANTIKQLVILTRLINGPADYVKTMIDKLDTPSEVMSELKYLKLDSPRTGVSLNERTLEFSREFLNKMIPKNSAISDVVDIYNNHFFKNGKPTKHRKLVINDESGTGEYFFSTKDRGMQHIKEQLMSKYKMTEAAAEAKARDISELYDPAAASNVNGMTYLSLPEMASLLAAKGANPEWFVRDNNGKVIGFNVVVKPIEYYSEINQATGEVNVFAGKTAYTYDPVMDAKMRNAKGEYILDSITFESTAKKNAHKGPGSSEFKKRAVDLKEGIDLNLDFKNDLVNNIDTKGPIVDMPRSSIFIKSISGRHDATMSFGFLNFLSNDAMAKLNVQTGAVNSTRDLMNRYAHMRDNPFSLVKIADQMKNIGLENGDLAARLMGIEGIIEGGGLPIFEYMAPQIERMTTSEYLGRRNFASSQIQDGGYNVMVAGSGLSMPIKTKGQNGLALQTSFGGSAVPHHQWNKPVGRLLQPGGLRGDGIGLIFTVNDALVSKFPEIAKSIQTGNDLLVTHDGKVLGPHNSKTSTKTLDRKQLVEFEKYMVERYNEILKEASSLNVETLGDLALHIDGKGIVDFNMDYTLDNSSSTSKANTILIGKEKAFQAVHIQDTNLRTPKAGLNDWVITKIEKLLDRRKGPVSEMNALDVIEPQQADFDLDKSSSFHSLPGKVTQEIYNVAGIIDPATNVFETALKEIRLENPALIEDYKTQMMLLESKRPLLVRQHSIASFLLQYYTSQTGGNMWSLDASQRGNFTMSETKVAGESWKISFKGGNQLQDAIGHTKKLIYAAIDIYKQPQKAAENIDLSNLVWTDPQFGMLRIERRNPKSGKWEYIEANDMNAIPPEVSAQRDAIINRILKPVGSIFDLARMTESYTDGTSRKMSLYDMVNRFQVAKNQIRWAGLNYKGYDKSGKYISPERNNLNNLSSSLLGFLGENYVSPALRGGSSEHPLIKGLMTMERGLFQHFKSRPANDTSLGALLAGQAGRSSESISRALKGIVRDQKKWAELSYLTHELNQLEDIMSVMRARGQRGTSRYKSLESQYNFKVDVMNQFNSMINAPGAEGVDVRTLKPGRRKLPLGWGTTGIYRKIGDKLSDSAEIYKGGDVVRIGKGDQVVPNFKRYRVGNENVNMQRRAMSKAFNVDLYGLSVGEIGTIDALYSEFRTKLKNASNIIDGNAPRTSDRFGLLSEAQLQVVADHLQIAMGSGKNSNLLGLQFLYRMLGPIARNNVYDVVGYDKTTGNILEPSFNRNNLNERLVFSLLDRMRNGKGRQIADPSLAQEWYENIIDRHKRAFINEWDPTLKGDVFNFEGSKRSRSDFDIMSMPDVLPQFVREGNLNKNAKDVLMSYLRGTYFLDPIELYRLTAGLGNTSMGAMPNQTDIGARVRNAWQGTDGYKIDPRGDWYIAKKPYRKSINEHVDRRIERDMKQTLMEEYNRKCR